MITIEEMVKSDGKNVNIYYADGEILKKCICYWIYRSGIRRRGKLFRIKRHMCYAIRNRKNRNIRLEQL